MNITIVILLAWASSLWLDLAASSFTGGPKKVKKTAAAPQRAVSVDYSTIARKNIFNPGGSPGSAKVVQQEVTAAAPTSLNLELLGMVITDIAEKNMAVISDKGGKNQNLYKVGDTVSPGAVISRIDRFSVYIEKDGRTEVLTLDVKSGFPGVASASSTSERPSGPPGVSGGGIREINPGQMLVDRSFLQDQIKDMSSLLTQVRAVPNKSPDGKIDGFKLFQIQKGSMFEKIGLKNMDVLKVVNGQPLNSAERGLELFSALKSESRIELGVVRNNAEKNIVVEIQ